MKRRGRSPAQSFTLPSGETSTESVLRLRMAGLERKLSDATKREEAALVELRRVQTLLDSWFERAPSVDTLCATYLEIGREIAAIELIGRTRR